MPDPQNSEVYPLSPLVGSLAQLNDRIEWFSDPERPVEAGPFVIVVDGFYDDPDQVRQIALGAPFFQYHPPTQDQVGAQAAEFTHLQPSWFSTGLVRSMGQDVCNPQMGFRYNPPELARRFQDLLGEQVALDTWESLGDWWNGAFHQINAHWQASGAAIHHHYRPGDVFPRGWSGVVYLSPDPQPWSGTSIWRHKQTGTCVASQGICYYRGTETLDHFDLAFLVENRYNRLLLFRENVLHRVETGFGAGDQARLTQTFFFQTQHYI